MIENAAKGSRPHSGHEHERQGEVRQPQDGMEEDNGQLPPSTTFGSISVRFLNHGCLLMLQMSVILIQKNVCSGLVAIFYRSTVLRLQKMSKVT